LAQVLGKRLSTVSNLEAMPSLGGPAALVPVRLLTRKAAFAPQAALNGLRFGDVHERNDGPSEPSLPTTGYPPCSPAGPASPLPPLPHRQSLVEVPEGAEHALPSLPLPPGLDLLIDAPRLATPARCPVDGDASPPVFPADLQVPPQPTKPKLRSFSLGGARGTDFRDWKRGKKAASKASKDAKSEAASAFDPLAFEVPPPLPIRAC